MNTISLSSPRNLSPGVLSLSIGSGVPAPQSRSYPDVRAGRPAGPTRPRSGALRPGGSELPGDHVVGFKKRDLPDGIGLRGDLRELPWRHHLDAQPCQPFLSDQPLSLLRSVAQRPVVALHVHWSPPLL